MPPANLLCHNRQVIAIVIISLRNVILFVPVRHIYKGVIAISAIVTLTMSPSVDLFGVTERLLEESKTRCRETARQPGGGGINVARTLHRLGADVLAVFTCGGANGELLVRMLLDEGVVCQGVVVST